MATEYFNDAWRIPNNKNQSLVSNYSMEFDGVSDVINTSFSPPLGANNRTISIWFKTELNSSGVFNICGYGTLAAKQAFDIAVQGSVRKIGVHGVNTNLEASGTFVLNEWTHYAVTYDGTILRGYVNGQPVNTSTIALNTGTTVDFTIGAGAYTLFNGFSGSIDQVSVFDYVLSASQVATLYGGGTAVTNPMSLSPKPIAYYQLGDQTVDNGANYLVPNNSLQDYVFNFDGTDDYIDLSVNSSSSVPSEQSSWTYSAWLYLDSTHTESFPNIFQRGQGYPGSGMLVRESGGNIQVYYGTSLAFFTVNKLLTNKWSHFALVYDISTNGLTCYINNSSQTTTMVSGWSILSTNFNIGFRNNNSEYWKGEMSNVQVFNTALSATGSNSIETIYNNGSPLTSMSGFNSLQSWYKLNAQDTFDGTNWTIKDYAGSNDGTSVNMTSANLITSDLQHTSGYSPYALSFDGINDNFPLGTASSLNFTGDLSISFWIKTTDTRTFVPFAGKWGGVGFRDWIISHNNGVISFTVSSTGTTAGNGIVTGNTAVNDGNWHHVLVVNDSTTTNNYIYIDGYQDATASVGRSIVGSATTISYISRYSLTSILIYLGDMSNFAFWNTVVTPEQVTEIYNSGRPSNLNNFSGDTPVHWWQFGSNSSFNAGAWTCLDEMGTLNAVSEASMAEDDITNGVGYSANGLGTSSIDIIGDAPYSTANGISENMDVLDRTTDVPS